MFRRTDNATIHPATTIASFITAWLVYMVAMASTVYDGCLSLIFQPIMAAIVAAITVWLASLLGLLLRIGPVEHLWHTSRIPAILMIVFSLLGLCFGYDLGWTAVVTDPDSNITLTTLHPGVLVTSYIALVFAIVNFPLLLRCPRPSDATGE